VGNTARSVTARNGKARRGSQGRDRQVGAGLGGARSGSHGRVSRGEAKFGLVWQSWLGAYWRGGFRSGRVCHGSRG